MHLLLFLLIPISILFFTCHQLWSLERKHHTKAKGYFFIHLANYLVAFILIPNATTSMLFFYEKNNIIEKYVPKVFLDFRNIRPGFLAILILVFLPLVILPISKKLSKDALKGFWKWYSILYLCSYLLICLLAPFSR